MDFLDFEDAEAVDVNDVDWGPNAPRVVLYQENYMDTLK
jgi:hypothetical protein